MAQEQAPAQAPHMRQAVDGEWSDPVEAGIPDRWEFDVVGDSNQGIFLRSEMVEIEGGKPFMAYDFRGDDGKLYSVLGSFSIDKAMLGVSAGTYLRLTWVGEKPAATKGVS